MKSFAAVTLLCALGTWLATPASAGSMELSTSGSDTPGARPLVAESAPTGGHPLAGPAWSPRFIEARDTAQGVPGGAQALAFAAWDLRVSMLYRAWKLRVGTEPTAEDLLNLNAIYYQFADANGQPLPVLPTRFDPAFPRNVVRLDLTDGHQRSFARLAHPVTWGTRAEIELSALPASAHGSVQ